MARLHADEIEHYRAEGWVVPRFRLPSPQSRRWPRRSTRCCATTPACGPRSWSRRTSKATTAKACAAAARFLDLARDPGDRRAGVAACSARTSSSGAATCSASRPAKATRRPGTRTATTGRSGRSPTAPVWVALEPSTGRERLPARHPALARRQAAARAPARGPHRPDAEPAHGRRQLRRGERGRHRARAGPDVAARRLHDPRRAAPTRSARRRTGVALRYMPATSVFERDLRPADGKTGVPVDFARRPLWLVQGRRPQRPQRLRGRAPALSGPRPPPHNRGHERTPSRLRGPAPRPLRLPRRQHRHRLRAPLRVGQAGPARDDQRA